MLGAPGGPKIAQPLVASQVYSPLLNNDQCSGSSPAIPNVAAPSDPLFVNIFRQPNTGSALAFVPYDCRYGICIPQ